MRNPWIVPEVIGRTTRFTAIAGSVLGAMYCAFLFIVFVFISPPSPPETLGVVPLPDPASLDLHGMLQLSLAVVLTTLTGVAFGAVAGAIVAGISGAVAGFVIGVITLAAFSPMTYGNLRQFRAVTTAACIIVTPVVAYLLGPMVSGVVLAGRIGADSPELWFLQAPFPALLGGVAACWASPRVADWYEGDYLESSSA